MLKHIILLFFFGAFTFTVNACFATDTTRMYFKQTLKGLQRVSTPDSADIYRVVLPPDAGDSLVNIREFYSNGNIKFIGKSEPHYINAETGKRLIIYLTGDCINYYPNGKRQSVAHYLKGQKEGDEYLFYPSGSIYCNVKNIRNAKTNTRAILSWECYDVTGKQVCSEGNGKWVLYDDRFQVVLQGQVKNGLYDGDWNGATGKADSVKYVYKYENGKYLGGVGYDINGSAYPFKQDVESPVYKTEPYLFFRVLMSRITVPRDANGKKMLSDTSHVSFVIEKDGHLDEPRVAGCTDTVLLNVLKKALARSDGWTPRKYYGIPLRTRITFLFKDIWNGYQRGILYREEIIGY